MARRSHRDRSCSSRSSSRPSAPVRVSRLASLSSRQRQQPGHGRILRQQPAQHPGQLDRPLHQITAHQLVPGRRGVPGAEQQVHHGQDGVHSLGQLVGRRDAVRDAGDRDLLLRPGDPGGHGGLADQEGTGDLGRGQAAHQPQGERHLCRPVECWVTAGHDQPQPVVGDLRSRTRVVEQLAGPRDGGLLHEQRQVAVLHPPVPEDVQGAALGCRRQPGPRPRGNAVGAPVGERGGEGILDALLGDVQVAGDAHRRGEHEGPLATVRVGDRGRDGGRVLDCHPVRPRRLRLRRHRRRS